MQVLDHLKKIIDEAEGGHISYAEFIELALYHPDYGYYMRETEKIGRAGDFITTSNVSDIFGRIVSKWFSWLVGKHGIEPSVCEIGGGNGRFAKAFMDEWVKNEEKPLSYLIVETSPFHRKLQKEALGSFPGFTQYESIKDIDNFNGLVFSNELFDALPVHVVERKEGNLMEAMVGYQEDQLVEQLVPLTNRAIASFIDENSLRITEGQRIEIPLAMGTMVQEVANLLTSGLVVTIDYGYTAEEWGWPSRKKGSLRGYMNHQMHHSVLENPGRMDITSHIHFDALEKAGKDLGLNSLALLRQDEFLISAGILKELEENYDPNPFSETSRRNRAIRSLVLPTGMSTAFRVLIQEKGLQMNAENLFQQ
nr:SAM-dependent methyltransferase [Neobacillus notoginsengisoli]